MPANYEQAITLSGDLHARPAGALAVAAAQFSSAVSITAGAGRVNAKSVNAKSVLAVMGGRPGRRRGRRRDRRHPAGGNAGGHVTVYPPGLRPVPPGGRSL